MGVLHVPQHRERILIVGFDRERYGDAASFGFGLNPSGRKPVMGDVAKLIAGKISSLDAAVGNGM